MIKNTTNMLFDDVDNLPDGGMSPMPDDKDDEEDGGDEEEGKVWDRWTVADINTNADKALNLKPLREEGFCVISYLEIYNIFVLCETVLAGR